MTSESRESTASLSVHSLAKSYPTPSVPLVVLDGVDLDLAAGDQLAVTGPSGSGKSTLLHILGGLDRPSSGSVEVDGRSILELPPRDLAQYRSRSVGFVFQDHYLLPQCSVLENVLIPCLASHNGASDRSERIERARWLLERVGMTERIGHRPSELSGGERQRVALARALVQEPRLVLCDEPTGNLDRATADKASDLILSLAQESSAILIVVTHSMELAGRLSKRAELVDGKLLP
jgi:lipoprotein-releasing system ATP-binding protein